MKRYPVLATTLALLILLLLPAGVAMGGGSNPRFLTLPFPETQGMRIVDGWWRGDMDLHRGIDYIKGSVRRSSTWQSFPIIAAAAGKACAAASTEDDTCIGGVGKRVIIKHRVDGRTYYTYYGHLRKVAPEIPVGTDRYDTHVKRGQIIGWAGKTGYPGTGVHLHFELETAPGQWLDPYDIYDYRHAYPAPTNPRGRECGPNHFWRVCPPAPHVRSDEAPPPPEGQRPSGHSSALVLRPFAASHVVWGRRPARRRLPTPA